jgi:MFS family permease
MTATNAETNPRRGVRRASGGTVLVGSVIETLGYWVLPAASVPLVGSVTAPELSDQVPTTASLGLLRLVAVTSVISIAVALVLLGWASRRAARVPTLLAVLAALVCSVVSIAVYLVPLARVDDALDNSGASSLGVHATSLTGPGFWVVLIGAVIVGVGAVFELSALRREH